MLGGLDLVGGEPVARIDRADLDRAGAQEEAAEFLGDLIADLLAQLAFGAKVVGIGDVGHRVLVVQSFGRRLEARRHVEDRLPLLHRDDAAIGEAASLEIADDAVDDRVIFVARAHEIGVERMGGLGPLDGTLRGLQCLCDNLAAEYAADAAGKAGTAIEIGVDLLDVEQGGELGDELGGRGRVQVHQYPAACATVSAWKLVSPNSSARTRARFM